MKTIKKTLTEKQTELLNKENKSIFDFVKLANVSDKIENKTASKVYKNVISSEYAKTILGTSKIPSFAEFVAKLPIKDSYSNWNGYLCLSKFNTKNETAKKVSRQNKSTAKK
jgi:N-glycosylase/DNA lyase